MFEAHLALGRPSFLLDNLSIEPTCVGLLLLSSEWHKVNTWALSCTCSIECWEKKKLFRFIKPITEQVKNATQTQLKWHALALHSLSKNEKTIRNNYFTKDQITKSMHGFIPLVWEERFYHPLECTQKHITEIQTSESKKFQVASNFCSIRIATKHKLKKNTYI
jgi:hypothetical protein